MIVFFINITFVYENTNSNNMKGSLWGEEVEETDFICIITGILLIICMTLNKLYFIFNKGLYNQDLSELFNPAY